MAPGATMAVLRDPGEVFLTGHSFGGDTTSWLERIDPVSLEPIERSPDLPGGPFWPGGVAAHANGSLYVTYGRWCHRLGPDCSVLAARELPRERPYNSAVVLPDGHLVMKDIGGGVGIHALGDRRGSELVVLEPDGLEIVARYELPEGSIARLSADVPDVSATTGADGLVYVVGESCVYRLAWNRMSATLELDEAWTVPYRTVEGQTFGWDIVLAGGYGWFLDNGEGTENFGGSFRGKTASAAPLHLVAVPLTAGRAAGSAAGAGSGAGAAGSAAGAGAGSGAGAAGAGSGAGAAGAGSGAGAAGAGAAGAGSGAGAAGAGSGAGAAGAGAAGAGSGAGAAGAGSGAGAAGAAGRAGAATGGVGAAVPGRALLTDICGEPGGIVANPPAVDAERGIAVGYDSGNGVLRAWRITTGQGGLALEPMWQRVQWHAGHPLRFADTGELVTYDFDHETSLDQVVVLDIETGDELGRATTESPVQSVLFPAVGWDRDVYYVSFTTIARVAVE
jgi:hypothetical protein